MKHDAGAKGAAARLATERLLLEPLSEAHRGALARIYREPGVERHLLSPASTPEAFERVFRTALAFARTHGLWALRERAGGAVVGRCGFLEHGPARRPEYAVLLATAHQGRGLGTEVTRAALRYGFGSRAWSEVVAVVRPANAAARALLARMGAEREGALERPSGRAELLRIAPERFAAAERARRGAV